MTAKSTVRITCTSTRMEVGAAVQEISRGPNSWEDITVAHTTEDNMAYYLNSDIPTRCET